MALTTPFARNGNRKAVPQTAADGSVNYNDGFGAFYALPPEEGGLFIDRTQFNQILYDTTSAVISNQNSINTLNSSVNTLNTKVSNIESGVATGVVNLTTNQTIGGIKTFSVPPVSATNPANNNQVANKAYVDTVGNTAVKLTGAQTIQGVKTFSSIPVSATQPTNANQVANKLYVDTVGNTAVKLTGAQSIAGAKTFTSDITAPNITAMQNSINTINTSLSTVVSDSFTPYLILKNAPLGFKAFSLQDGAGQDEIDDILAQAVKYRFYRLYLYGTVTGNISFGLDDYAQIIFNYENNQATLIGNLSLNAQAKVRIVSPKIQNGQLIVSRYSQAYLLSGCNITAPATKSAIEIGSGSSAFTDVFTQYPLKPFNLTSDTAGITIDNGASFVAGRGATINTANTPTKIILTRGSFASLNTNVLSGDGADFNIATNTVTANGIIMR